MCVCVRACSKVQGLHAHTSVRWQQTSSDGHEKARVGQCVQWSGVWCTVTGLCTGRFRDSKQCPPSHWHLSNCSNLCVCVHMHLCLHSWHQHCLVHFWFLTYGLTLNSKTDDWCRLGVRTCVGRWVTHPALCWALSHPPCSVLGTESPTLLCVSLSTPPSQQSLGIIQLLHGRPHLTAVTSGHWRRGYVDIASLWCGSDVMHMFVWEGVWTSLAC